MQNEKPFTALILVTSQIKPEIEERVLEALAPFAIKILDQQSMTIRDRYFLAILFALDRAHAKAIEKDLYEMASGIGIDLAIDYQ